jgi:hypothetical protein
METRLKPHQLGAKAMATRLSNARERGPGIASAPPGHPPEDVYRGRGRSPGLRVIAFVRPSRARAQWPSLTSAHRSQFCRGQRAGLVPIATDRYAPVSLLASRGGNRSRKGTSTCKLWAAGPHGRQENIKTSLYISL